MTIYNSTDYGFCADPAPRSVEVGDTFRLRTAEGSGSYEMRILRRHRDAGYWETAFVSGGPRVGIHVMSERAILAAMLAA